MKRQSVFTFCFIGISLGAGLAYGQEPFAPDHNPVFGSAGRVPVEVFTGLDKLRGISITEQFGMCGDYVIEAEDFASEDYISFDRMLADELKLKLEEDGYIISVEDNVFTTFLISWEIYDIPSHHNDEPDCLVRSSASVGYGITVEVPWNEEITVAEANLYDHYFSAYVRKEGFRNYLSSAIEAHVQNFSKAKRAEKFWHLQEPKIDQ